MIFRGGNFCCVMYAYKVSGFQPPAAMGGKTSFLQKLCLIKKSFTMYAKENISAADQQIWANSGLAADQTSTSSVDYNGAKSLTLNEGKAYLETFEANDETRHFARFGVSLDNGYTGKESGRQLFKGVYMQLPKDAEIKDFTITRSNGSEATVKGIDCPAPMRLLRRFPSLSHDIDGHVPFKGQAQRVNLKTIDKAVVLTYDKYGKRFMRIVENYAVEA